MSIYRSAVEHPVTTALLFVALAILGIFSLSRTSIAQFPEFAHQGPGERPERRGGPQGAELPVQGEHLPADPDLQLRRGHRGRDEQRPRQAGYGERDAARRRVEPRHLQVQRLRHADHDALRYGGRESRGPGQDPGRQTVHPAGPCLRRGYGVRERRAQPRDPGVLRSHPPAGLRAEHQRDSRRHFGGEP